jgi:peptidoglycan-N-acetylglucosamine deacetylase
MRNPFSFGSWRPIIHRQPEGITDVALTFDDGPTPVTTPGLLDILARNGARATFFLSGVRVAADPGLVRDLVAGQHAVYGHAWEHVDLRSQPSRAVRDMQRVEEILARFRPTPTPYLIRLPHNAGYRQVSMHRAMARFHDDVRFAWCTLNTRDYALADGCGDLAELQARCDCLAQRLSQHPLLPGSIVLLHEAAFGAVGPLNPQVAGMLLPRILDAIRRRGLETGLIRTTALPHLVSRFVCLPKPGHVPV